MITSLNHGLSNGTGISGAATAGSILSRNLVYANARGIAGGTLVTENTVYGNSVYGILGTMVTRNVVDDNWDGIPVGWGTAKENRVYDNRDVAVQIWDGSPALDGAQFGFDSDYNLFWPDSATMARWQGVEFTDLADWFYQVGQDQHSLMADPRLVDPLEPDGPSQTDTLVTDVSAGWTAIRYEMCEATGTADAVLSWGRPESEIVPQVIPPESFSTGSGEPGDYGIDNDFHLQSTNGSFHGGSMVPHLDPGSEAWVDPTPVIDRGDAWEAPPTDFFGLARHDDTATPNDGSPEYVETELGYNFVAGGTAQHWRSSGWYWKLTLPFAFPFYNETYTDLWVSSEGSLQFVNPTGTTDGVNSTAKLWQHARIAPLWDDLRTDRWEWPTEEPFPAR